ncbi:MAG TPA: hypothetical protein VKU61_09585 [Candidatus Binatia bacterium]|nr:hypothetical protein [Candidatus Binatia bacterium]
MPDSTSERDQDRARGEVNARLSAASDVRETVDLILAVRGRVVTAPGARRQRWRIRTQRGHVLTFRPEFVVAVTPARRRPAGPRPTTPADHADTVRD